MKKIILLSTIASMTLMAGAYKIPEQSVNSMALGAAYIAHTNGADTAYFNPANMSFLDSETRYFESGITLAHLPANSFDGVQAGILMDASADSEVENLPIPYTHYVSKAYGNLRYGVSIAVPAGLTKRWESPIQKAYAEEFTLKNVEFNPSVSYRVSDTFSVAGGLRVVYSEGIVKSDGGALIPAKREMEGDVIANGFNLAAAWHPSEDIAIGATYRSKIKLKEKGQANLYLSGIGRQFDTTVEVPIPAAFNIGISKTWNNNLTVELVYERTLWSAYETLDFEYTQDIQPALVGAFDKPKDKNWKDTNTYRIGLTYQYNDRLTLMAGYSYDETPIPDDTMSYELPDSDAHIFSAGFKYKYSENITIGAAVLYDHKVKRSINNSDGLQGEFSDGGAILSTVGVSYTF